MVAFTGLGVVYRKELDQRREECRRLAAKLLESRLGKPRALEGTAPEISSKEIEDVKQVKNNIAVENHRTDRKQLIIKYEKL